MRYIQSMVSVWILVFLMSCDHKGNDGGGGGQNGNGDPKSFATAAEAANAAKADMLAAMDKGVNFGVDKEQLRAANPAQPLTKGEVDFNALLSADSLADLERMANPQGNTMIVPLVNGNNVVAVVGLRNSDQKFQATMLGERQLSTELAQVMQAFGGNAPPQVVILEIPNLQAIVYKVMSPTGGPVYFTAYNNNSLRQPLSPARLIPMLRADAQVFQREYGDKVKGQKLVR